MFTRPDNTYNDIREKSLMQWLGEMEQHSDVAVRGGVKLTGNMCSICRRKSDDWGKKTS